MRSSTCGFGFFTSKVKVITTSTNQIVSLVARHDVDVGICQTSSGDPTVRVRPIAKGRVICAFSSQHRLARKKEISPFDLRGENLITFPESEPTARRLADAFNTSGVKLNRSVETSQSFSACCVAMQGSGIAIVDSFIHAKDYFPQLAVRPFTPEIEFHVDLHLSDLRTPPPLVQELCEALIAAGKASTE